MLAKLLTIFKWFVYLQLFGLACKLVLSLFTGGIDGITIGVLVVGGLASLVVYDWFKNPPGQGDERTSEDLYDWNEEAQKAADDDDQHHKHHAHYT